MRAAGTAQTAMPSPHTAVGAASAGVPVEPVGKRRNGGLANKIGENLGFAFGWLVLAPVFMGLLAGTIAVFVGGSFAPAAVVGAGIMFAFSLFAGIVIVGFKVFVNFWPIIILALLGYVIFKAVAG